MIHSSRDAASPYGPARLQYSLSFLGGVLVSALCLAVFGYASDEWPTAVALSLLSILVFGAPILYLAQLGGRAQLSVEDGTLQYSDPLFLRAPITLSHAAILSIYLRDIRSLPDEIYYARVRGFTLFGRGNAAVEIDVNFPITMQTRYFPFWNPLFGIPASYVVQPPRFLRPRVLVLSLRDQEVQGILRDCTISKLVRA